METETATASPPEDQPADEFAIVEVFGHRKHAGRILEVERFGTKLLRIDIPKEGDFEKGYSTHFYGGPSIFSMTPCDLATVQRANRPYQPASLITHTEEPDDDRDPMDDEDPF